MNEFQNWYEKAVFDEIYLTQQKLSASGEYSASGTADNMENAIESFDWSDVACIALNQLPPKYIRHSVDMTFYLTDKERVEMEKNVRQAVLNAWTHVRQYPVQHARELTF